MKYKLKKNIGFSLIPFAFLFLFDPHYTLVDPLPDFIGYIILVVALSGLSQINYHVDDAKIGFKKGIAISIFRFVAIYVLQHIFATDEQSVGVLLFIFTLSVFELIILIPAYKSLFEGLLALGMMHDGNCVYYKKIRKKLRTNKKTGEKTLYVRESRLNISEKTYYVTVASLIIRCLAVTLPEFTSLTNNTSYEFVNILRLFGYLIALPLGIVCIVLVFKYFLSICNDTVFIHNLEQRYAEVIKQKPNVFVARDVTSILYFLLAAFVLSFDFFVDHVNIVPNAVFYIIILASIVLIRKYSRLWIPVTVCSFIGVIISVLTRYFAKLLYTDIGFSPIAVKKDLEVYLAYNRVVSFTVLDVIFMLITVILLIFVIWDLFKKHTNYYIAFQKQEFSETKELKRRFVFGSMWVILASLVSAAGNIYYVLVQPFENNGNWYIYYAPIMAIVLSIAASLMFVYFIMFIVNCVSYRYRTDI